MPQHTFRVGVRRAQLFLESLEDRCVLTLPFASVLTGHPHEGQGSALALRDEAWAIYPALFGGQDVSLTPVLAIALPADEPEVDAAGGEQPASEVAGLPPAGDLMEAS